MKLTPDERAKLLAEVPPERQVFVTNLLGIEPTPLRWLWWPYLPLGKVVIVAGAPGHGKSQLTAFFAAAASRGMFSPSDIKGPARTLLMSAEDDLEDTVVPRLLAANGDLRLVDTMQVRTTYADGLTADGMIRIPGDAPALHAYVQRFPDTCLAVLDPVASFFDRKHSSLNNQDVRDALDPLVAIAKRYAITIVVVLHLNKGESRDFAARIAESHGFQAVARCVLALGPDPDDPDGERGSKKVLAITKANLAEAGNHAMRCEVRGATVLDSKGAPVPTSEIVLTGRCEISVDDLLMTQTERTARTEAADWLADFLADRWVKVGDLKKAAASDGISWRTVERVREAGDYKRAKQLGVAHGPWWVAANTVTSPVPVVGGLDDVGGNAANTAKNQGRGAGDLDDQDRQDRNAANNASDPRAENNSTANDHKQIDLDEYRRVRDRRLGERDEDE
jgi:hypothetical protein